LQGADAITYKEYREKKALYDANEKLGKKERDMTLQKPIWRKFILADYTPEALANKHSDNPRGIGVCVDELAGWFKNFNRYNKGSEQEFWLSNWSGKAINIDRKSSEPILILNPFICVAGTIQPAVLNKMAADDRAEIGFFDRILFVAPEIRKEAWRDSGINPEITAQWAAVVGNLLELTPSYDNEGNEKPNTICFTPDAHAMLMEWQKRNTDRINEDEDFAPIGAKGEVYAARLALIVRALRYAADGATTAMRVRKAVTGDPLAMMAGNRTDLYNALPDTFTTSEGLQAAKKMGLPERTANRFIANKKVFTRVEHGKYRKNII
jgi:hypothetical protein